jgi:hypothetical protein
MPPEIGRARELEAIDLAAAPAIDLAAAPARDLAVVPARDLAAVPARDPAVVPAHDPAVARARDPAAAPAPDRAAAEIGLVIALCHPAAAPAAIVHLAGAVVADTAVGRPVPAAVAAVEAWVAVG